MENIVDIAILSVRWKVWWEIELQMERGEAERGGKVGFMVQLAPRVVIYTCNKPSWGISQKGGEGELDCTMSRTKLGGCGGRTLHFQSEVRLEG
jgi:hypothetical protein